MIDDESPLADGPPPRQGKGRSGTLAEYSLEELVARWEEFFAERGLESAIIGLADRYPEERSLAVRFEDLNRFDTDMSIHLLRQPLNVLAAGEEAVRRVVPPTEEPVEIHLRIEGLPRDSRVQIRDLRAKHLGRFIAVEGLVRKATEVRPMVVDALFQCLRCGTVIKEPQEGQAFREPMECYEDQGGCKRSASATKFKLLGEASRYSDTQKIEIQEAPEGLRGGEEPRRLSAFAEDDLTGKITPGMRVVLNGILRSSQRGRPGQKSTLFDIMLDVNAITFEQVEFEEIEVTEEDAKRIEAEAADPDIFRKIVASIAPSLYGLTTEKEALALQLFGGVPKEMPDGRRIRGDIHLLLVGDPGTGKSELLSYMSRLSPRGIYATGKAATAAGLCIAGESLLSAAEGARAIEDIVQPHFDSAERQQAVEVRPASGEVLAFNGENHFVPRPVDAVWRLEPPHELLEIRTESGHSLLMTPATRLLINRAGGARWMQARFVLKGMKTATMRDAVAEDARPPSESFGVHWDAVAAIRVVPSNGRRAVYDLTVRDAHAFLANGILVHNTAAAVRDEFGEGRWTLEAGALVLADKGLACLHPSTEVLVDGVPTSVASLFRRESSEFARAGGKPLEISRTSCSVAAFDLDRLSAREARTSLVSRRAYRGPIVRITLDSGLTLAVTPDHVVLDGDTLRWRRLEDLRPGGRLVSAQRLPSQSAPVRLLDIVPDNWIVGLTASEKRELSEGLVRLHGSTPRATREYGLRKDALTGRGALKVLQLRRILGDTGLCARWRDKTIGFGRSKATERLKVAQITPELAYVMGFIQGDGSVHVDPRHSSVSVFQSARNLRQIRRLLEATKAVTNRPWGMHERVTRSRIRGHPAQSRGYHMHRGSNLMAFLHEWITADGFANLLRLDDEALRGYVAGAMDSDGCISVRTSTKEGRSYQHTDVEFLLSSDRRCTERFILALRRFDIFARLRAGKGVYRVQVTSRPDVDRLLQVIRPYAVKWRRLPEPKQGVHGRHLRAPAEPVARLLQSLSIRATNLLPHGLWSTFYEIRLRRRVPYKEPLARIVEALTPGIDARAHGCLAALAGSDYALDRIQELRVEEFDGYVYDLRVPDGDNFLAGGAVVHNCIDELEKMNPQDRSAIHEALEQQRVSVAKAGITAVLQARCAVLAAANPKFGRFDETKFVSEQLDLAPTLLSRFDAIFSLMDRPESERDRNMAEHILRGHLVGEWRRRREEGKEVPDEKLEYIEAYEPHFDPLFFRKYVAYAKRVSPVMTQESMDAIKAKYLEIRKAGEPAGASVPITPRQLEAIIRLSEASARARLSSVVAVEDTERAIRITEYWMRRVAGEEGRFDIDIVQVGISQSQREQIINLREVIGQLSEQSPSGAADYEDVVRAAGERGMNATNVDKWLKRWAEEGDVYSPAKSKYKLVERL